VGPSASAVLDLPPGRLVFDRFDGGPEGHWLGAFIADSDGGNERQITVPVPDDGGLSPNLSADGRKLLVDVGRPAIMGIDGTDFRALDAPGFGCSAWSPDGTALLCDTNSRAHVHDGIYSLRLAGSRLTQLTTSPYYDTVGTAGECGGGDGRAVFSPDGKRFAFIRQKCGTGSDPSRDETGAIEVANADGSDIHEIVHLGGVLTHPGSQLSWSPDGQEIAFGSADGWLSLVHPDGSGLRTIELPTARFLYAFGPTWSPDGSRLAFSTQGGVLFTVAPDGSDPAKVPASSGGEVSVHWGVASQ